MKALVDLEMQVAWRTVTGVEVSAVMAGALVSVLTLSAVALGRETLGPAIAPALLFASLPWIFISSHVLDIVDGLAAARPVSRGRMLHAHLSLTGCSFFIAGLLSAVFLRAAFPDEQDRTGLFFPLVLTATGLSPLVQQAQRRKSWFLSAAALGVFLGFIRWGSLRPQGSEDLAFPPVASLWRESAPLFLQAALASAAGTWAFLRGESPPGGSSPAPKAPATSARHSPDAALPGGWPPVFTLLWTSFGSWNLPILAAYPLWMSLYLRSANMDGYVLGLSCLVTASSLALPISRCRSWFHLPMARARAFRTLVIPPLVLILVVAGIRGFVVMGKDRTRTFAVAERHEDGSFSVDWVDHQTKELERTNPAEVAAYATSVLEDRWGIRADGRRVEARVLAGWPGEGLVGRPWTEQWAQVSAAYERVRIAYEDEIRGVLRYRAIADVCAALILLCLLFRIVFHPWKRNWQRGLALVPMGGLLFLVVIPGGDLSGGWGPDLRDGFYGAFQAHPLLVSAAGAAMILALLRSSRGAFARMEWDMLGADSKSGLSP